MNNSKIIDELSKQISFFGELTKSEISDIEFHFDSALRIVLDCCKKFTNVPRSFNLRQTQHSAIFLYQLSRVVYESAHNEALSTKIYLLNRMLNSVDMYYKIKLPRYLLVGHGLGTVFSNAIYGEYLVIFQNTTIGIDGGKYPRIGNKVVVYSNCLIAGDTVIGDNCTISPGTILVNEKIPENSIVFGAGKKLTIKQNKKSAIDNYFFTA